MTLSATSLSLPFSVSVTLLSPLLSSAHPTTFAFAAPLSFTASVAVVSVRPRLPHRDCTHREMSFGSYRQPSFCGGHRAPSIECSVSVVSRRLSSVLSTSVFESGEHRQVLSTGGSRAVGCTAAAAGPAVPGYRLHCPVLLPWLCGGRRGSHPPSSPSLPNRPKNKNNGGTTGPPRAAKRAAPRDYPLQPKQRARSTCRSAERAKPAQWVQKQD